MTADGGQWSVGGKLCLVTGATNGIGRAMAGQLAADGAQVIAIGRDESRGRAVVEEIRLSSPSVQVEFLPCDLSDMAQVRGLALRLGDMYGHLDVLVNNAGVSKFSRQVTVDGFEMNFAVNHLAPFVLTNALLDQLGVPSQARVITVSSDVHKQVKSVPWDDLQSEREFKPIASYGRTKLMNIWFTRALAERLGGTGITANCFSPGFIRSGLSRDARGAFGVFIKLSAPFQKKPAIGAVTGVYLASSPEVTDVSGEYFRKCSVTKPSELAQDADAARRLWDLSAELSDVSSAGRRREGLG